MMIRVRTQQREISKDLPTTVQERLRVFRVEGVHVMRKVALLEDGKGQMLAAVVYGVSVVPIRMIVPVPYTVRWVYVYESKSWVFRDHANKKEQRFYREKLLKGTHLEETRFEMNMRGTAVDSAPFVRFVILNDTDPSAPRAVLWPAKMDKLRHLHALAFRNRNPAEKRDQGVVKMAGMFHVVPLENGAFPHTQTTAHLVDPVPDLVATTRAQHLTHIQALAGPYKDALVVTGGDMRCLCVRLAIETVQATEHAKRPVMFSVYVSRQAAAHDGKLRPIPSLYVPFMRDATAWCVVPLKERVPSNARLHIDAYQEMNNAAGTRVSHCKIAHAHFSVRALMMDRSFSEQFTHCVDHDKRMFTATMRHDKAMASDVFGVASARVYVNPTAEPGEQARVPPSKIRDATNAYIQTLHHEIERCGGITARFPSGKLVTPGSVVEVSKTTEGTIPLVSYFNMSARARILAEQRGLGSFFENLCRLACVLCMVSTDVAEKRLREPNENMDFCLNFLATCVRAVPTCLAYSVDKEGENNTLPWSVPNFVEQQVDCEELALLCAMIFQQMSRQRGRGMAADVAWNICSQYDPMLCLVTTSSQSESSSSSSRMAEEADATHLVCVLWPRERNQQVFRPILLETMANVAPLSGTPPRKDHRYFPPSLHPLYTQEQFTKDRTYRDVIRVFLFDREHGRYVENLVCQDSKRGVGAPFVDLLSNAPSICLVPIPMVRAVAEATDLTSELTYPLGLQLDTTALEMSSKHADKYREELVGKHKCSHVFLLSTDRRSMATLAKGKPTDALEKSIQAYLLEEIKLAERTAIKLGEDASYTIEGVMPEHPFYLLPGLHAHVVGIKVRRPLYLRAAS